MKDRKEYIEKNRHLFDDKEPSADHMKRFEALLNKQENINEKKESNNKKRILFLKIASAAASIALVVGIGIKFYAPKGIDTTTPNIENVSISDEFRATNDYYNQQMEEYIADIMCKLSNTEINNQSQLSEDLQNIIENNSAFVQEMEQNENKEIAIRYLVKHYKANIQALENINKKLGKVTNC